MKLQVRGKTVFAASGGKDFDPAGEVIIFIHGSGMDRTVWQLQTRYFAWHGRSVLAVDLPGHGKSEGPALTEIGDIADWVRDLMDAAGVGQAALVGHSLGAIVALEAAARFPDRIRAIALCGVAESMAVHPGLKDAADKGDHLAYELITSWGFGQRAHLGGAEAPGAWMMGAGLRLLERDKVAAVGADLAACNDYKGAAAAAEKVRCPVLFVVGDSDKMTAPKGAAALAARMAKSDTVMIAGSGHMMMIEQPGATLDALRTLL